MATTDSQDYYYYPSSTHWACQNCNAVFSTREQVRAHVVLCKAQIGDTTNPGRTAYMRFQEARTERIKVSHTGVDEWKTDWTWEKDGSVTFRGALKLKPENVPLGMNGEWLVCGVRETPGDVPKQCNLCGTDVRIAREYIKLWGRREPPPVVACQMCVAKQDDRYWLPIEPEPERVPIETLTGSFQVFTESFTTAANTYQLSAEHLKRSMGEFKQIMDDLGMCERCGKETKGGAKVCKTCQRQEWRRGR